MAENKQKQDMPHGIWPSPISALMVGQGNRFNDVGWDDDGETLVWMEGRSNRGVLLARTGDQAPRELTVEENVRAWVGYGGGDFRAAQGSVFFVEIDGRIYRRGLGNELPVPLTPAFGRTASPALSPDGQWLLFVYSDRHTDMLGMVDATGTEWPVQISRGADFYMQPTWHPDGKRIAWVEWDHPNMPWDETRIMLGSMGGSPLQLLDKKVIANKTDLPAQEPRFSPDGRWLSYVTSNGEWDDLVLLDLESGAEKDLRQKATISLTTPGGRAGTPTAGPPTAGSCIPCTSSPGAQPSGCWMWKPARTSRSIRVNIPPSLSCLSPLWVTKSPSLPPPRISPAGSYAGTASSPRSPTAQLKTCRLGTCQMSSC